MKSSRDNENDQDQTDAQTEDTEYEVTAVEGAEEVENVRNYSEGRFSGSLKKIIIILAVILTAASIVYFKFFHSKNNKPNAAPPAPPIEIPTPAKPPSEPAPKDDFSSVTQPLDASLWKDMDIAGKFKVSFPGTAERESGELQIDAKNPEVIKFDSYFVNIEDQDNYNAFFVNVATFPASFTSDDQILKKALENVIATDERSKLISSSPTSYNGNKAMDFVIQADSIFLKGKIVVKGKVAYTLAEGYFEKNLNEDDFNKFINSLTLSQENNSLAK